MNRPIRMGWFAVALVALSTAFPARAVPGDERWDFRFSRPALDAGASAAAWFRGELYVGGAFETAGHSLAAGIARWDGTNWWPVGDGLATDTLGQLPVLALAVWGDALYAGGYFTRSGTNALPGLARWDGTNWTAVPGLGGRVRCLLAHGNALYVAGGLRRDGDANPYGLARWDGVAWDTFDSRIAEGEQVSLLAARGDELFVSGSFTSLGGQPISYNAWWNGTAWQALPGLTNRTFWALAVHQGELYGSASFTWIGQTAATNLARWDGTNWWPVGDGPDQPPARLLSTGTGLFAVGAFKQIGGQAADGVARWDGAQWQPLGLNTWRTGQSPSALCVGDSNRLFAVGYFTRVAGQRAGHVAEWTGEAWRPLVAAPSLALSDHFVLLMALATGSEGLFAGGSVTDEQGQLGDGVFLLRTNTWQRCGWFGSRRVFALAIQGTNLLAGGRFTQVDGVAATNIARWDGATWQPLGDGTDAEVFALATDGTRVYVGGAFTNAGGVVAPRIACWDGTHWSALGAGMSNGSVSALAWAEGRLYAGGSFTNAGGVPALRIACWDGEQWQPLGAGVEGTNASVNSIAVGGSNVYVGGRFTLAGGAPANNVARWDGARWWPLGKGTANGVLGSSGIVYALAVRKDGVYVGGRFTTAGGLSAWGLARFDGTNWSTLGSGLRPWTRTAAGYVRALAWAGESLWVGGLFPAAGNRAAASLARWVEVPEIQLAPPRRVAAGGWQIELSGLLGLRYRVESSEDLTRWSALGGGCADADQVVFQDAGALSGRFYRVALEE